MMPERSTVWIIVLFSSLSMLFFAGNWFIERYEQRIAEYQPDAVLTDSGFDDPDTGESYRKFDVCRSNEEGWVCGPSIEWAESAFPYGARCTVNRAMNMFDCVANPKPDVQARAP